MLARSSAHSTPRWHPGANPTLPKHVLVHSENIDVNRLRRGGAQASARASDGGLAAQTPQELPDGTLVYTFGDSSDSQSNRSQKQRSRASQPAANPAAEQAADSSAPKENGTAKSHAALQPMGGHSAVAFSEDADKVGDHEVPATDAVDAGLQGCTVKQLTQLCKEKGFKGYSGLNKAGLVELLTNVQPTGSDEGALTQSEADDTDCSDLDEDFDFENADLSLLTVKQLKLLCRQRGLKGYSGLRKQALVGFLSDERK